ncbi:MAG: T9SS type A sorting domain-containing protein [Saprospiraceae bacterium]|nr:T9SS type A sorting domain-containing protein [Saprospiraceae bacterium]
MKPTFNIILLILTAITLSAQKYDYNWFTGYSFREDTINPNFRITHWQFNTPSLNPKFSYDTFKHIDFAWAVNNMSDFDGNFLFNYNGAYLENYKNEPIQNGALTDEQIFGKFNQTAIILPSFLSDTYNLFHKIYHSFNGIFTGAEQIFHSNITINKATDGIINFKNKKIVNDTLDLQGFNAVKHANGRDWIILDFEYNNEGYKSILFRNNSVHNINSNKLINFTENINIQTAVSPNGKYFLVASVPNHVDSTSAIISLFNFKRESGLINLVKQFYFPDSSYYNSVGVAFSPNSKYFYISRPMEIFQVEIVDSLYKLECVAKFDGFVTEPVNGFFGKTYFGFLQIAPDGRIYGTSSYAQQRYIFYINKPNLKGKACDVRQHAIKITMHSNLPTFPNYRLGPIDGSESDSLGIDNIPVAEFRYDQDTMNYRSIDFTNLSWYEPEEFWWDWGDGSQPYYTAVWDTSIIHTYARDGIYEVCLRAKNKNGESTKCKKINIGTTATKDAADNPLIDITLSPNPMREILIIQVNDYLPEKMIMNLYDLQGNKITTKRLYEGSNIINTESLSSGVYVAAIIERKRIIKSEKIVKL